jgi:hypothetical protein
MKWSEHARKRARQRNIDPAFIDRALQAPGRIEPGGDGARVYQRGAVYVVTGAESPTSLRAGGTTSWGASRRPIPCPCFGNKSFSTRR